MSKLGEYADRIFAIGIEIQLKIIILQNFPDDELVEEIVVLVEEIESLHPKVRAMLLEMNEDVGRLDELAEQITTVKKNAIASYHLAYS